MTGVLSWSRLPMPLNVNFLTHIVSVANANAAKLVLNAYCTPIFMIQACFKIFQFSNWGPGTLTTPSGYAHVVVIGYSMCIKIYLFTVRLDRCKQTFKHADRKIDRKTDVLRIRDVPAFMEQCRCTDFITNHLWHVYVITTLRSNQKW